MKRKRTKKMSSVIQTTNRNNVIREDENMRTISTDEIIKNIKEMCIEANYYLSDDMKQKIDHACRMEESPLGRQILSQLEENMQIAEDNQIPICQDTGMAVVFLKIGQDVHIEGMNLEDAVNDKRQRIELTRFAGKNIEITVAPKGFGSENMSRVYMLKPADGIDGVKEAVLDAVKLAGPNACPPLVVGVGIGGTFEKCALLAKKALTRDTNVHNSIPYVKEMEEDILEKINNMGIGPAGLGGRITALAVNIETYPTHIAGLPVAVNMCCHVNRHKSRII